MTGRRTSSSQTSHSPLICIHARQFLFGNVSNETSVVFWMRGFR
jgi:hypothetical protein